MCGIAGIVSADSSPPVESDALRRMTSRLVHRGPDEGGEHVTPRVALGHRRLRILGPDAAGRQPMRTADGRFTIAYNGECYNYVELRDELRRDGIAFRTATDTEVVLQLFAREGPACLERMVGMFAFAVWDEREQELFLVRDRAGIKPLYYARSGDGTMVFASEVRALLASGRVPAGVEPQHIDTYMRLGYVTGDETLFRGVRKLPPATWMRVRPGRPPEQVRYWELEWAPDHGRSLPETAVRLRELLRDSVRLHARSDVPMGVFLSGGFDSSAIVALLAECGVTDLATFSVAYGEGSRADETPHAQRVAERFGTEHHALYVTPDDFLASLPAWVEAMEEPMIDAPALSLWLLARRLGREARVALSGEGSDELFGGYSVYRHMRWMEAWRRIPATLAEGLLAPAARAVGGRRAGKYTRLARLPLEERYTGVHVQDPAYRQLLYSEEFRASVATDGVPAPLQDTWRKSAGLDTLTRMQQLDIDHWLIDDLLIKADRMTMAHSVELRVPYLDHRVVEFAATIPPSWKLRRGASKWILKRALEGIVPPEISARRKLGFPTPVGRILRADEGRVLREVLLDPAAVSRGYFRPRAVESLLEEHLAGGRDHHRILWQLLVLEMWHKSFIDRPALPSATNTPRACAAPANTVSM